MSKREKESNSGKSGLAGILILVILVVAVILFFGKCGGGGLFPGKGSGSNHKTQSDTKSVSKSSNKNNDNYIEITVSEKKIFFNNSECQDIDDLKKKLTKNYKEGDEIVLRDDKAIKSSYDEVKALLNELGYIYTIA